MKRTFKILTVSALANLFLFITLFAQTPEKMTYQSILRKENGSLHTNITVGMQVSILQYTADGLAVYTETHNPLTNQNGLISIEIGGGNTSDDFGMINWADGPYFVKAEIDPDGGSDYTIISTSQLLSVPYAMYANHSETSNVATSALFANVAETVQNIQYTETDPLFSASPAAGITQAQITQWNNAGGTTINNLGDIPQLNALNRVISGVNDPLVAKDVVNKQYLDFRLQAAEALLQELLNMSFYITDVRDGKSYEITKICDAWWMKQNLNYKTSTGSFYYNNDSATYANNYGRMYTFAALTNACPAGWRAPTDQDWKTLEMCLGMTQAQADASEWRGFNENVGRKLKSNIHWDGTNTSFFTAKPGGSRDLGGNYSGVGNSGFFWTSTPGSSGMAWLRQLTTGTTGTTTGVRRLQYQTGFGFSLRCVRN
jgi:uncharacterized protein (TIGR02145 family)